MKTCVEKSLPSMQTTGSLEIAQNISIEIRIQEPKLRSGLATARIARTLLDHIRLMAASNQSFKGVNPGEGVRVESTIRLFNGDDREPAWVESISWMAV